MRELRGNENVSNFPFQDDLPTVLEICNVKRMNEV